MLKKHEPGHMLHLKSYICTYYTEKRTVLFYLLTKTFASEAGDE